MSNIYLMPYNWQRLAWTLEQGAFVVMDYLAGGWCPLAIQLPVRI